MQGEAPATPLTTKEVQTPDRGNAGPTEPVRIPCDPIVPLVPEIPGDKNEARSDGGGTPEIGQSTSNITLIIRRLIIFIECVLTR